MRACLHPDLQQMADNVNLRRSLFPRLDPLRLVALLEKVSLFELKYSIVLLSSFLDTIITLLSTSKSLISAVPHPTHLQVTPTPLGAVSLTSNLPLMDKKFLQVVIKKFKAQSKA